MFILMCGGLGVDEEKLKGIIATELKSKDYATTTQLAADINAAKDEITTARNTALESYATKGDVDTDALTGKLSGKFVLSNGLSDTIKGLKEGGKPVFATTESVETSFSEIGDTIADDLLADTAFKEGVLSGLSTELQELPSRVADLEDADYLANKLGNKFVKPATLEGFATTDQLEEGISGLDSKFVLSNNLSDTIAGLKDTNGEAIFVTKDNFGTRLTNADLSQNSAFSDLNTTVSNHGNTLSGLDTRFVKDDDLEDTLNKKGYLVATDLDKELTNLAENKDSTFGKLTVTADEASGRISTLSGNVDKLSGKYTTLNTSVGKLQTDVNNMPSTVIGSISDPRSDNYIGQWKNKTDGKYLVVTSDNVSKHKDTLGTGIDNLLADKESKTRLHEAVANASSALTNASSALSVANAAQTTANTASTDATSALTKANTASTNATSALTKANTATSSISALTSSVESLNTNAVTKSSLTQDLYNKLTNTRPDNSTGHCSIDDANLKNLLTGVASGVEAARMSM